jgi:2,3-dihydroxy-p-cumate/2,3-dihydroxybenzoate 3,4-dioxygenase
MKSKLLHDIEYVRMGTADLDASVVFATRVLGLEVTERTATRAYVRGDNRDYNICYTKDQPGRHSVGFTAPAGYSLDEVGAALESAGVVVRRGTAAECDDRRVPEMIVFRDPTGNVIEVGRRPPPTRPGYVASRDAGITCFGHVGLRTAHASRDEAFWTSGLGAQVSDWIGEAALLRIDDVHHKIALFPSNRPGVQHINFQVSCLDDLMRSYYFMKEHGVHIVFGPGRHPTSGARFLYFQGPDGMVYEYSWGVRTITQSDEASYQPRRFPFAPASFCSWGSRPDIPEFRP